MGRLTFLAFWITFEPHEEEDVDVEETDADEEGILRTETGSAKVMSHWKSLAGAYSLLLPSLKFL